MQGCTKIIVLCGPSGCGKDTLRTALANNGATRIITYTTRRPRNGERDGVDYNFVDSETFVRMKDSGEMVEGRAYESSVGTCYFGSKKVPDDGGLYVVVLDDGGVRDYKRAYGDNALSVFLDMPAEIRRERAFARNSEDSDAFSAEWGKRAADDDARFSEEFIREYVDVVIRMTEHTTVDEEVELVMNALRRQ